MARVPSPPSAPISRAEDAPFWAALSALQLDDLADEPRRWLARRWARVAQAEHASIASFAKFALQLTAVGAPPELLIRCHQAAIDEVHHARLAFALASRFAGEPLGPGPLDISGALLGDTSLLSVAIETANDGCVNETLAAAEAAAAGDEARAPAIALAMRIIERDESRHAELAWAFVGWAVATGGNDVLDAVAGAVEAACRSLPAASDAPPAALLDAVRGYGTLGSAEAGAARRAAVDALIRPAMSELRRLVRRPST